MKTKILQKIADFICKRIQGAKTQTDVDVWFNIGMKMNTWCVERDIWLN